jgi:CRP/FNR family cyclic AMP-dependent transcriptional regulator
MHADIPLDEVIQFLLDTPMFEHLNEEELSTVVHILELQRVQAGEVVFSAGDAGDAWFVIFQGTVEISHFGIEGMRVLTRLGSRGCFGEMAILDGDTRSAKAKAIVGGVLFRIPRQSFNRLLREGDLAAYKLVHRMALLLAARIRSMNAEGALARTDVPVMLSDDAPTDH